LGSAAGVILAWPKPDQTGVSGPKVWVRSTLGFEEMSLNASASVGGVAGSAWHGEMAKAKTAISPRREIMTSPRAVFHEI
jgi:hypothetical protein